MEVDYYHQKKGFYGNIYWDKALGKDDLTHPVKVLNSVHELHPLERFRSMGYYASCFPEGDGIAIIDESGAKTAGMVADDIITCFGWDVCIKARK